MAWLLLRRAGRQTDRDGQIGLMTLLGSGRHQERNMAIQPLMSIPELSIESNEQRPLRPLTFLASGSEAEHHGVEALLPGPARIVCSRK